MQPSFAALLRGVNVGGKNRLPMKDLAEMFVAAGCTDVRTLIQSGNVVFRTSPKQALKVPDLVGTQITSRFGFRSPVVLRTEEQLEMVLSNNPFLAKGSAEDWLFVMFLADLPSAGAVAGLDPDRSPGDSYIVQGRDIYLCLPNGSADSKLTNAYFDSKLSTVCTGRNWRTVTKLREMMRS